MKNNKATLFSALSVIFIDFVGIGIIYPLFPAMLFDPAHGFFSPETSAETRGAYLGILLSLSPLVQFFSAPIWGGLSDNQGRKRSLHASLLITVLGYVLAVGSILMENIFLLFASRVVIGLASGNMSIVQAAVADISTAETKAKNFGLYSMSLGAGFALGPFFGGFLSQGGYVQPFLFALLISLFNLLIVRWLFKETFSPGQQKKHPWNRGLKQLVIALKTPYLRSIFLTYFLHCFAWSFFFEFVPVFFMKHFAFTAKDLGIFYGLAGGFYALSTGVLIRPLVRRMKAETLFFGGNFCTAFAIFSILLLPSATFIWAATALISYCVAFVSPTATTLVSNRASPDVQGETLGVLGSANAAALVLSPLFSGAFVGRHPALSIWISSSLLLLCALLIFVSFRKQILCLKN